MKWSLKRGMVPVARGYGEIRRARRSYAANHFAALRAASLFAPSVLLFET